MDKGSGRINVVKKTPNSVCLVCNTPFCESSPGSQQIFLSNASPGEYIAQMEDCFSKVFGLSSLEVTDASLKDSKTFPFCSVCTLDTRNLLNLQKMAEDTTRKLAEARIGIATSIVNTFAYTTEEKNPFAKMRNLIFAKWYDKIDNLVLDENPNDLFIAEKEAVKCVPVLSPKKEDEVIVNGKQTKSDEVVDGRRTRRRGRKVTIDDDDPFKAKDEVTCTVCNKTFRTLYHLDLHMKSNHDNKRPHKCGDCSKAYFCLQTLKRHQDIKHGVGSADVKNKEGIKHEIHESPYGRIVTKRAKVTMENGEEAHLIIGTREDTPPPELEDETLNIPNPDWNPIEAESDIISGTSDPKSNDIICDECGKSFVTKVTLSKHIRTIHLKTIKVECPVCHMTTRDHFNLSKHILWHDPKLTKLCYNCGECGDGFLVRRRYFTHYRKKHSQNSPGFLEPPPPIVRALQEQDELTLRTAKDYVPLSRTKSTRKRKQSFHSPENVSGKVTEDVDGKDTKVPKPSEEESKPPASVTMANPSDTVIPVLKPNNVRMFRKKRRRRASKLTYNPRLQRQRLMKEKEQRLLLLQNVCADKATDIDSVPSHTAESETTALPTTTTITTPTITKSEAFESKLKEERELLNRVQEKYPIIGKLNFDIHIKLERLAAETVLAMTQRTKEFDETVSTTEAQEAPELLNNKDEPPSSYIVRALFCQVYELEVPKTKVFGPKSELKKLQAKLAHKLDPVDGVASKPPSPTATEPIITDACELRTEEGNDAESLSKIVESGPDTLLNHPPAVNSSTVSPKSPNTADMSNPPKHIQRVKTTSPISGEHVPKLLHSVNMKKYLGPKSKPIDKNTIKPPPGSNVVAQVLDKAWKTNGPWFTECRNNKLILKKKSIPTESGQVIPTTTVSLTSRPNEQILMTPASNDLVTSPVIIQNKIKERTFTNQRKPNDVATAKGVPASSKVLVRQTSNPVLPGRQINGSQTCKVRQVLPKMVPPVSETATTVVDLAQTTPEEDTETGFSPVIQSTCSLAGQKQNCFQIEATTVTKQISTQHVSGYGSVADRKPGELKCTMRKNDMSIRSVGSPRSSLGMPRLPSGITLLQVDHQSLNNTPTSFVDQKPLFPQPKRRFVITKRPKSTPSSVLQESEESPIRIKNFSSLAEPEVESEDEGLALTPRADHSKVFLPRSPGYVPLVRPDCTTSKTTPTTFCTMRKSFPPAPATPRVQYITVPGRSPVLSKPVFPRPAVKCSRFLLPRRQDRMFTVRGQVSSPVAIARNALGNLVYVPVETDGSNVARTSTALPLQPFVSKPTL